MVNHLAKRVLGIFAMMMLMLSIKVSAAPVTVKSEMNPHGSVTVDKNTAEPGDIVTITVTPYMGYYAAKENVKAEKTLNGVSAQAPGLRTSNPDVGSFIDIQGDAPADISEVATYTFIMPETPYGVQVSAEFSARSPIFDYFLRYIPDQEYTGSEITPDVVVADGDTYQLVLGEDYTIEFSNNIEPGQATCAVIGMGKYMGRQEKNFKIFRESYEIRWGQGNPWPETTVIAMEKDADGKWVAANQNMIAASEFKVVKVYEDGATTDTWLGTSADDMFWVTNNVLGTPIQLGTDNNLKNLYFPNAGIYTFTFDPTDKTLVVTGDIFYNVTIADGIQNGTVSAQPTSGKAGDQITLTATADPGFKLSHLYLNDEQVYATDNEDGTYTYTFAMPAANVTVNADFSHKLFYITKAQTVNGSFDISMSGACYMGDFVEIYPEPDDGYDVEQVTVTAQDGTPVEVTPLIDRYRFTMPASDVTVAVTFKALDISYEIRWGQGNPWTETTVIAMTKDEATGKWVATDQSMIAGSEFKVVKKAQSGDNEPTLTWFGAQANDMFWVTDNMLGTQIKLGTDNNYKNLYFPNEGVYTFTFDPADSTLVVSAHEYYYDVEETHCVTLLMSEGHMGMAYPGRTVTLQVVPDGDYDFKEAIVNKVIGHVPEQVTETIEHTVNMTEDGKTLVSFVMPAANVEVQVICALIHIITLDDGNDGKNFATIDNQPRQAVEGETVTVRTFVDPEYQVSDICYTYMVDGQEVRGELTEVLDEEGYSTGVYTFIMPDADVTVVVRFDYKFPRHQVIFFPESDGGTVSVTANGTLIQSGDQVAEAVSIIEVTATPNTGYRVESFKVYEGIHNVGDDFTDAHEVTYETQNGKYRFEMPRTDVTIIATFAREFMRGDLNGDGLIDVSDIGLLINIILKKNTIDDCVSTPDLNDNGMVDVSDFNILVNIILGKE